MYRRVSAPSICAKYLLDKDIRTGGSGLRLCFHHPQAKVDKDAVISTGSLSYHLKEEQIE